MAVHSQITFHFGALPSVQVQDGPGYNMWGMITMEIVSDNISADYTVGVGLDLSNNTINYTNGGAFDLHTGGVQGIDVLGVTTPGGVVRGPFLWTYNQLDVFLGVPGLRFYKAADGSEISPGTDIQNLDVIRLIGFIGQDASISNLP